MKITDVLAYPLAVAYGQATWTAHERMEGAQLVLIEVRTDDGLNVGIPLSDLGMTKIHRDPGTGYHQPKGIMIWHGVTARAANASRPLVESAAVKDMILYAMTRQ